jgi:hypothetical protein
MFVRKKKSGKYQYLQIVENQRVNGRVVQKVITTLGRFAEEAAILEAHREARLKQLKTSPLDPHWFSTGCGESWDSAKLSSLRSKNGSSSLPWSGRCS